MRLDWFLPAIRREKPNTAPVKRSAFVIGAKRLLPAWLFSDWKTKRRGVIRRGLRKLGMSWLASPNRRIVQSLSLGIFLVLFFWVCWPYDAQPAKSWSGWTPIDVVLETGKATLINDRHLPLAIGSSVYVSDHSQDLDKANELGEFVIVRIAGDEVQLSPVVSLDEATLEKVVLSTGPWTLNERAPHSWPDHYAANLAAKEKITAELFLIIDPLVSLSTSVASRSWVWSLSSAAIILIVCVVIPRGFCGYLCPLGTLIDLFDWSVGSRITRFRLADEGWWVHIKYYLLLGIMVSALCGVLISGIFAAIPVITRGLLFTLGALQNGTANGWHQVPPLNPGHYLSLGLFFAVFALGLFKPRFWCKYICPSGAVFSLGNLFRASERKVEASCIHCNKCVEICPFDAIKLDFTTRVTDCTLCQSCAGVCPTQSIKFVGRWEHSNLKKSNEPATHETILGRRGFVAATVGTVAGVVGGASMAAVSKVWGGHLEQSDTLQLVRPPGSVPEQDFLQMCIRCGECFKACPSDVLQPLGFQQGLEGLWTPHVVADWAGCASSCNACGQVCPTGAIRALPLEEKRAARMGLAVLDHRTCLPHAGREACQLCVDECISAGYNAIEFTRVGSLLAEDGLPLEDSGYLAPVVIAEKCVGCGLCQTRCYGINVASKNLLNSSAIIIEAGAGKEDRIGSGSYQLLRRDVHPQANPIENSATDYLPSFMHIEHD